MHAVGQDRSNRLYSDVSAVLGVIPWQGLANMRQLDMNVVFVQRLNTDTVFQSASVLCNANMGTLANSMSPWSELRLQAEAIVVPKACGSGDVLAFGPRGCTDVGPYVVHPCLHASAVHYLCDMGPTRNGFGPRSYCIFVKSRFAQPRARASITQRAAHSWFALSEWVGE